ncbi:MULTISPECIES: heavy-metal-associated domain-containing protein [unclassified Sedimentibacter]|uniref:heavy-metal-associated domain-containing protein n=1 Tax=unclassified Sedimentibacter TaxID=2649220 RepID=UPI0027E04C96|nr:heavy metal-associated domain-containing protein [Sedimentibacter sp. MB35-C1]WMJ77521.1 heavy metal-associated domain-containing protein [Sedimentibacter sp. MB35-C1]
MKKVIVVEGMDNMPMGSAVSRILEGMSGVDKVILNLEEKSIIVEYVRGVLTEDELCDAINEEGFEVIEIFEEG